MFSVSSYYCCPSIKNWRSFSSVCEQLEGICMISFFFRNSTFFFGRFNYFSCKSCCQRRTVSDFWKAFSQRCNFRNKNIIAKRIKNVLKRCVSGYPVSLKQFGFIPIWCFDGPFYVSPQYIAKPQTIKQIRKLILCKEGFVSFVLTLPMSLDSLK